MLAGFVQGFTLGTALLDLGHLCFAQLGTLGQRLIDFFHVGGTMEGKCGAAAEGKGRGGNEMAQFHNNSLDEYRGWCGGEYMPVATDAQPGASRPLFNGGR